MKTKSTLYDSRQPLESCEYKTLNRQIGVRIEEPFHHHGLNKEMVDIEWETISTNSVSYGKKVETSEWKAETIKATTKIIEDLDRVISELKAHSERLVTRLVKLRKEAE